MTDTMIEVELNIYSGRPNPSWQLSTEEINELKKKLNGIKPINKPTVPPQLGYRGFMLMNSNVPNFPSVMYCYNGVISFRDGKSLKHYEDTNRIEWWLVAEARRHQITSSILDQAFPSPNV